MCDPSGNSSHLTAESGKVCRPTQASAACIHVYWTTLEARRTGRVSCLTTGGPPAAPDADKRVEHSSLCWHFHHPGTCSRRFPQVSIQQARTREKRDDRHHAIHLRF